MYGYKVPVRVFLAATGSPATQMLHCDAVTAWWTGVLGQGFRGVARHALLTFDLLVLGGIGGCNLTAVHSHALQQQTMWPAPAEQIQLCRRCCSIIASGSGAGGVAEAVSLLRRVLLDCTGRDSRHMCSARARTLTKGHVFLTLCKM